MGGKGLSPQNRDEDVLKRPENLSRLGLTQDDIDTFLTWFLHAAETVERVYYLWRPLLPDENDNMFVECAFVSDSDYIVTLNTRHFRACQGLFNFDIVLPRDFLAVLRGVA